MRTQRICFDATLGDLAEVGYSLESLSWFEDCLKDIGKLKKETMKHFGKSDEDAQLKYIRQTILPELDVVIPFLLDVMDAEGEVRVGLPEKKEEI